MDTIRQRVGHGDALAGFGGFLPPLRAAAGQIGQLFALLMAWEERARQRRALAELDDRMLKDIGLSRAEVAREIDKAFWQG